MVRILDLSSHVGMLMNHFLPVLNSIYMIFTGAKTDQAQLHISGLCSGILAALFFPSSSCFPQSICRRFHSAHPTIVTTECVRSLARNMQKWCYKIGSDLKKYGFYLFISTLHFLRRKSLFWRCAEVLNQN